MADWSLPLLSSSYANFLSMIKDRDLDAAQMFLSAPTNPVTGMIRYVRATNKFQEYDGAVWNDKLLAIAGGGTGGGTAADARTNLGLASMATQAASAVVITGGVISGLSSLGVSGNAVLAGQIISGSGAVTLTHANGKLMDLSAATLQNLSAAALTGYLAANMAAGGTFPAISGVNLTALNASNLASGTVAPARLGSGSGGAVKFLREDSTWQNMAVLEGIRQINVSQTVASGNIDVTISPALTTFANAFASFIGTIQAAAPFAGASIISNSLFRFANGADTLTVRGTIYIVEFKP